ncbi:MAG: chalcone isomerase family protein [Sphingobacteriaceae bacterium]|jgi:hypothetical protein
MKKLIAVWCLMLPFVFKAQMEVEGVKIPYTFKTDETTLVINGAGVREKYFLDLYVGALYLKAKSNDAAKVIAADEAMCMKLHIVSGMITSEKMTESTDEGFKRSTNNNTAPIQAKINQFKAAFSEKISKGDVFDIVYETAKGSCVYKNNKLIVTIPGMEFKKALFGIWLCNDAAASDLKKKLIGK